MTFSKDVRKQDRFHVLGGVARTAGGRRMLWELVRNRIESLPEEVGPSHLLAKVLTVG